MFSKLAPNILPQTLINVYGINNNLADLFTFLCLSFYLIPLKSPHQPTTETAASLSHSSLPVITSLCFDPPYCKADLFILTVIGDSEHLAQESYGYSMYLHLEIAMGYTHCRQQTYTHSNIRVQYHIVNMYILVLQQLTQNFTTNTKSNNRVLYLSGYTSKVSTFVTSISQTLLLSQTDINLCIRIQPHQATGSTLPGCGDKQKIRDKMV